MWHDLKMQDQLGGILCQEKPMSLEWRDRYTAGGCGVTGVNAAKPSLLVRRRATAEEEAGTYYSS
jgi:hypothetical protein